MYRKDSVTVGAWLKNSNKAGFSVSFISDVERGKATAEIGKRTRKMLPPQINFLRESSADLLRQRRKKRAATLPTAVIGIYIRNLPKNAGIRSKNL